MPSTSWQSTQSSSFWVAVPQVLRYSRSVSAPLTKFFPTGCIEAFPVKWVRTAFICERVPMLWQ